MNGRSRTASPCTAPLRSRRSSDLVGEAWVDAGAEGFEQATLTAPKPSAPQRPKARSASLRTKPALLQLRHRVLQERTLFVAQLAERDAALAAGCLGAVADLGGGLELGRAGEGEPQGQGAAHGRTGEELVGQEAHAADGDVDHLQAHRNQPRTVLNDDVVVGYGVYPDVLAPFAHPLPSYA